VLTESSLIEMREVKWWEPNRYSIIFSEFVHISAKMLSKKLAQQISVGLEYLSAAGNSLLWLAFWL
jgi:hypothetical protein